MKTENKKSIDIDFIECYSVFIENKERSKTDECTKS